MVSDPAIGTLTMVGVLISSTNLKRPIGHNHKEGIMPQIITTGHWTNGFHKHVLDEADLRSLPVPNTPAARRYWINKFRDNPELVIDELGQLELLDVAWATTWGNRFLALL